MYAERTTREIEKEWLTHPAVDPESLDSLVNLAGEIQKVLVPVEPRPHFRRCLREKLLSLIGQIPAWKVIEPSEKRRWAFVLAAATGSLLPLLGVAAYLWRARLNDKPQHATSH